MTESTPTPTLDIDPRFTPRWSGRRRLPSTRRSLTHKFVIHGQNERFKGFLIVGLYDDATPGEIFITVDSAAPDTRGALRDMATMTSITLQWGCPIATIIKHLIHHRYEPAGLTSNPAIPIAKSISDYIGRWLAITFLTTEQQLAAGIPPAPTQGASKP